ncbi:MAG: TonB-dependent receptor, partial [Eudoraea sp.]|nr:TonB-dependent receptor [Eudoraea sp.]
PNLFNASLGYESKGYSARLSVNFSDAYITSVGGRSFEDVYYDRQLLLDFNVDFKLNENLSLYIGLNNITDQPLRLYQGRHERTAQAEYYDRKLTFGLKYDVFRKKKASEDH